DSSAVHSKVQGRVAFPIIEGASVTAVLEFVVPNAIADDVQLLRGLDDVGRRAGEVFQRRKAEERLLRSEASLLEAERVGRLGSWMWDVASDRVSWSDEMFRIFDVQPGSVDLTAYSILGFVSAVDRDRVLASWKTPLTAE